MKNKRKIIAHMIKKMSKTYSFRFTVDNEQYIKAQPNREKFINELIFQHRQREMQESKELEKWRSLISK